MLERENDIEIMIAFNGRMGGGLTLALLTKKGGGLGLWTSPRSAVDLPCENSAIIFPLPFRQDKQL